MVSLSRLRPYRIVLHQFKGNKEFYLIDEQKVAYETVRRLIDKSLREIDSATGINKKYTIIIQGGPGTGVPVITG